MKNKYLIALLFFTTIILLFSFQSNQTDAYSNYYKNNIQHFLSKQSFSIQQIKTKNFQSKTDFNFAKTQIDSARKYMKKADFWLRYLEPLAYKKINSPLPVEWETEVFEKHEKPYKRIGAGLTLAELYLEEENFNKDTLLKLLTESEKTTNIFLQDSITQKLKTFDHFYFCNRLFLLNLASIYTTGFECPDSALVIPELKWMLTETMGLYKAYNESFPNQTLSNEYLNLFQSTVSFVNTQPNQYSQFNHFTFIKDFINPLFAINQQLILQYQASSKSNLDYSLNKKAVSIFDKQLYIGQNIKGIFLRVKDEKALQEITQLGKLLFYDPILSGNNKRSCASCHNPTTFFADTLNATSLQFNQKEFLARNSPSLLNAQFNHLSMLDGKHHTLQNQCKAVITNPVEMAGNEQEVMVKVLSCKRYLDGFSKLLKFTPQEKEITFEHIVSAITMYYGKFSNYSAPFDNAIKNEKALNAEELQGFNLFMSKAQCATCHFVPQFNGVKPPFISSEFEVLGTPNDANYKSISADKGRYHVHEAEETHQAFRTGSLRNIAKTKPYMHNGVFKTLEEVIDFYDGGGGAGRGFKIENQTLSSDSLRLTKTEKRNLILFLNTLTENIGLEEKPESLPLSKNKLLNTRVIGGEY